MNTPEPNNYLQKVKNDFNSFDGIFLKKEEKFSLFMDPTYYLMLLNNNDSRIESITINDFFYLFSLQNKIHYITEYFLNSYNLLDPFLKLNHNQFPSGIIQPKNLTFLANKLNEKGLSLPNFLKILHKIDLSEQEIDSKSIAQLLATFYQDFEQIISSLPTLNTIELKNQNSFEEKNYQKKNPSVGKTMSNLNQFVNNELSPYLHSFFLHGSLATQDYITGCSDCDTFAILTKESAQNETRLLQLQEKIFEIWNIFYRIDKLQHHGIFFSNEIEVNFYPQSYFPVKLFDYSLCMFTTKNNLVFKERDSSLERKNTLWNVIYYFRSKFLNDSFPSDLYVLKEFFQVLLLSPTIFLQLNGDYLYKKFSFEKIKSYFTLDDLALLDIASEFRKNNVYSQFLNSNNETITGFLSTNLGNNLTKYRLATRITIKESKLEQLLGMNVLFKGFQFTEKLLDKANLY